ncbi:hypothetical protein [Kocuria sp. U4B]
MQFDDNCVRAYNQIETLAPEEKRAVVRALVTNDDQARDDIKDLFPKNDWFRFILWMTLLLGLFSIVLRLIYAIIDAIETERDVTVLVALATTALGGILGLFAKSPVSDTKS